MKKLLFSILFTLFCSAYTYAEDEQAIMWQDKWSEALLLLDESNWDEGKEALDEAILLTEKEAENHPYLYVDRARLNALTGDFSESLNDLERALSSPLLDKQEKIRALTTKIFVEAHTGNKENLFKDLASLQPLLELPLVEVKEGVLIIKNIPKRLIYEKLISCYLIHIGLCYDKGDISFLKQNKIVAEKINHCGCQKCIAEYAKTRECDSCYAIINPTKENVSVEKLMEALVEYVSPMKLQLEDQVAFLVALLQIQQVNISLELFDQTLERIFEGVGQGDALYFD